ncbi:ABC transporter, substrate-binding protein, partial [mine drainage metagenome]
MALRTQLRSLPPLLAAGLSLCLAGCGAAPPKPAAGGTIRVALIGAPGSIDPLKAASTSATEVDDLIYDGLVRVSPALKAQPDLATRWRISKDGRTYTFQLNPKARWQDGS